MTDQPTEPTESPDPSDLTDQVEQLQNNVEALVHESGGITLGSLGREIARIDEQVQQLADRINLFGDNVDEKLIARFKSQMDELSDQIDKAWKMLAAELDEVKKSVNAHGSRLNEHDDFFEQLHRDNEERDTRLRIVATSTTQAHERLDQHDERITVIESGTDSTPRWALPVAVILGFIAALFWAGADFKQRLGDEAGSEFVYEFADGPLGMILFGIGIAAIAWFVFSFFGNQPRQQTATEQPADSTQRRESFTQRVRAGYQEGRARARRRPSDNDEPQPTRQPQEVNA